MTTSCEWKSWNKKVIAADSKDKWKKKVVEENFEEDKVEDKETETDNFLDIYNTQRIFNATKLKYQDII